MRSDRSISRVAGAAGGRQPRSRGRAGVTTFALGASVASADGWGAACFLARKTEGREGRKAAMAKTDLARPQNLA